MVFVLGQANKWSEWQLTGANDTPVRDRPSIRGGEIHADKAWKYEMRSAIRDSVKLCELLELPASLGERADRSQGGFPVFVPQPFLRRIRVGDPNDPLLKQVLPDPAETKLTEGFSQDPVGDQTSKLQPGVIQKYPGRALLVVNGACAVHCRYCFRRHFPYETVPHSPRNWQPVLNQIAQDTRITELILSGGDPLTMVDASFRGLVDQIAQMPHVQRLRIHTRLPVVIPSRVTDELIEALQVCPTTVVVVHINHPQEIDEAVSIALKKLVQAGALVLNQAVLLRGINDSVDLLADLSLRLVALRVMPYYLNQLDRVAGAAHFEVPVARGKAIIKQLADQLPGYAVPKYVQDLPDCDSKQRLA